jgi:serine/threonine-protein kinase
MRALEKLPTDRWSTADDLAEALDEFLRSRVRGPRTRLVQGALAKARMIELANDGPSPFSVLEDKPPSLRPALIGYAALCALVIGGAVALQFAHRGAEARESAPAFGALPAETGGLLVIATPWAEVFVDGNHRDTTPFARAIALTPGTHYVRLEHPNAKPETRIVKILRGETATLDVTMDLSALLDGGPG